MVIAAASPDETKPVPIPWYCFYMIQLELVLGLNYLTGTCLAVFIKVLCRVPPGSDDSVKPEQCINYEFGFRHSAVGLRLEAIGFYNDYSNLTGSWTFSSGCAADELDLGFNANEVDIWRLEALFENLIATGVQGRMNSPIKLTYTLIDNEFPNGFTSPRPDLSDVSKGDKRSYIPEHQLWIKATIGQL